MTEVLSELRRIESSNEMGDELIANIELIASIVDSLYIKANG